MPKITSKPTTSKPQPADVKRCLTDLVATVSLCIQDLDRAMKLPGDGARGKAIAKIANVLEYQRDVAARYGLGKKFKGEK